ncbi:uncharacterized protein LOC128953768 [Oppia nitens]|uniref:uncharacterized protein LOC128953768 n=1 Tax=Oppia nitens TaxID=1686743 RepID=UPI0023DA9053|nr:uncharacterized protein LOC128953768 [Oppia nitens]
MNLLYDWPTGIKGIEQIGWKNLNRVANILPGVGSHLSKLFHVLYLSYWSTHGGNCPQYMDKLKLILDTELNKYPNYEQVSGRVDSCIIILKELLNDEHITPKRFLYFELMVSYALKCDWDLSIEFAEKFRTGSLYTPAIATYFEGVVRYCKYIDTNDLYEKAKASELFKTVPELRVRHLGKTITPEKIAIVRSEQYIKCNEILVLPQIESLYSMNSLSFIHNNPILLNKHLDRVNKQVDKYANDIVLLRLLNDFQNARQLLNFIIENESRIGCEFSLPAQAVCELGLIEVQLKNTSEATKLLNKAINEYTGYLNEMIVHFKAYAGLRELGIVSDKQEVKDEDKRMFS